MAPGVGQVQGRPALRVLKVDLGACTAERAGQSQVRSEGELWSPKEKERRSTAGELSSPKERKGEAMGGRRRLGSFLKTLSRQTSVGGSQSPWSRRKAATLAAPAAAARERGQRPILLRGDTLASHS